MLPPQRGSEADGCDRSWQSLKQQRSSLAQLVPINPSLRQFLPLLGRFTPRGVLARGEVAQMRVAGADSRVYIS